MLDKNEDYVRLLLGRWEQEKGFLSLQFKLRKKEGVKESMARSIDNFTRFLCIVNNVEHVNKTELYLMADNLSYKPNNFYERITFIQQNLNSFHSFIQLGQLFEELTKQYFKYMAIQMKKNSALD